MTLTETVGKVWSLGFGSPDEREAFLVELFHAKVEIAIDHDDVVQDLRCGEGSTCVGEVGNWATLQLDDGKEETTVDVTPDDWTSHLVGMKQSGTVD